MAKGNNVLKFRNPASMWGAMWREGLPTGSGKVGASVFGGAGHDVIVINHNDLWWQGHTGVLPDISDKLKATKTALDNGNFSDAEYMLSKALISKNYHPKLSYPLPLCDFKVTMPIEKLVREYSRSVNMENGEVNVSFKDKNSKYDRNLFVSRVNDVICYQITKSGQKLIDCNLSLTLHDKFYTRAKEGMAQVPDSFDIKCEKDYLYFSARNDNGTDFGAVARIQHVGGTAKTTEDGVEINGADKVFVYIKTFIDSQKEKEFEELKAYLFSIKLTYDKLLREHANIHNKLFNAAEISLYSKNKAEFVDDLVLKAKEGNLPVALTEKLYAYGRYLFICSTCTDGQPCNPYGLFNGDYKAEESTRNNYLQTQRLYNFALSGNLVNMLEPLFLSYQNYFDDYKKNAMRIYNCKGIYVPALTAPGSGLLGSVEPGVIMNFNVAAIISQMMYEYYMRSDNTKFIKDFGREFITETANFYEDILKTNKTTGTFESPLGYSPYNTPKNCITKQRERLCIASNCVIDFVCAKQVFGILVEIGKNMGLSDEEVEKYATLLKKVPDVTVDDDGLINEYNSNVFETNNKMPHIPHLFPYSVGFVPAYSKRDYEKLVINTSKARFNNCKDLFTSGSLINIATALATTGDGNASYEVLQTLTQSFITSNLIFANTDWRGMGIGRDDAWAVYSIDKNTAFANVLQNMFITGNKENVTLFKNLPAEFSKGSVSGILLNNQIKAELDFNKSRGQLKLRLRALKNTAITLNLPDNTKKVKGITPDQLDLEKLCINNLILPANKTVSLIIKWANKV